MLSAVLRHESPVASQRPPALSSAINTWYFRVTLAFLRIHQSSFGYVSDNVRFSGFGTEGLRSEIGQDYTT